MTDGGEQGKSGPRAVICASTGNTFSRPPRLCPRGGMRAFVIIPDGLCLPGETGPAP